MPSSAFLALSLLRLSSSSLRTDALARALPLVLGYPGSMGKTILVLGVNLTVVVRQDSERDDGAANERLAGVVLKSAANMTALSRHV